MIIMSLDILFINQDEVTQLLSMPEVIDAVEEAFKEKGLGLVQMPPKVYVYFNKYNGDFRVMPAYLTGKDIAGVKVVNVHPENPTKYNLPTVMATVILLDPKTGAPIAIIEGSLLTAYRTGAAGGIAIKYLARKDSRILSIVGAGVQGHFQLLAAHVVMKQIDEVRVVDIRKEVAKKFAEEMSRKLDLNIIPYSSEEMEKAVKGADILITTTPVRKPIIKNEWVSEGMHINAIGADAPGKEELDPQILKRAKVVVDDIEQASHSGEINVPISKGLFSVDEIYAELGEIVAGMKPGRESDDEITIFDSTGLAIQDVATGFLVYNKAKEKGLGKVLRFF